MNNLEKLLEKQFAVKTEYETEIKSVKEKHKEALQELENSISNQINTFIESFNSYLEAESKRLGIYEKVWGKTYDGLYNLIDKDIDDLVRDNEDMIFQNSDDEYNSEAYFKFGNLKKINSYSKDYIRFDTSFGHYDRFSHDIPSDWFVDSDLWKNYIDIILKEVSQIHSKKQEQEENKEKELYIRLKSKYENQEEQS